MSSVVTAVENEAKKIGTFLKSIDVTRLEKGAADLVSAVTGVSTHSGSTGEWSAVVTTDPKALMASVVISRNGQNAVSVVVFPVALFGAGANTMQTVQHVMDAIAKYVPDAILVASILTKVSGAFSVIEALAPVVAGLL